MVEMDDKWWKFIYKDAWKWITVDENGLLWMKKMGAKFANWGLWMKMDKGENCQRRVVMNFDISPVIMF